MNNMTRLAFLLVTAAIFCSTASAVLWNPDGVELLFNLNFESNITSPNPTTTDATAGLVGRAMDYNSTDPCNPFHMWDSNAADGKIGNYVGNFNPSCDANTGVDFDSRVMFGPNTPLITPSYNHIFDLGTYASPYPSTFTFWFNVSSDLTKGTIFRHANVDSNYTNNWWEIRILNGQICFAHGLDVLNMNTVQTLDQMGILPNTWHHVAITYDIRQTSRANNKIYIDGVQVDSVITDYKYYIDGDIDTLYRSPVQFGTGSREFDGMLDDFRIYDTVLGDANISILYQTDYKPHPFALSPYPNAYRVAASTALSWEPNRAGATAQTLYFGTDPCNWTVSIPGNGTMNSASNGDIGGPLTLGATYYWDINTTVGGIVYQGPVWKFTVEDGKAYNPIPTDGQQDVNYGYVNLQWTGCPSASSYDVYFSNNQSLVASDNPAVKVASAIPDHNYAVSAPLSAETYYWRIVSKLPGIGHADVNSDVWSFKTKPYPIVFNTDSGSVTYSDGTIPGYTCMVRDPCGNWTTVSTGRFESYDAADTNDGLTIIFDFNNFSYTNRYAIIVLPSYGQDLDINKVPTSLCIDVNGNFYFDGTMNISGDDSATTDDTMTAWPKARCGGYRGEMRNASEKSGGDSNFVQRWTAYGRFPPTSVTSVQYWVANPDTAYRLYGPGMGITLSKSGKVGGGGGYGGTGGDCGRGYFHAIFGGGPTYGDVQVPVPFGGSSGGWGGEMWGAAGGGGVEIITTGNVTLDTNSIIKSEGGSCILPSTPIKYSAGGGAGGSVRIIAGGSVTLKGVIDVNGGKGGDNSTNETANAKPNNVSGGGGGGRVAVFYGTTYTKTGSIAAKGGAKGVVLPTSANGFNVGKSLAENGQDGTIYETNSSPRVASAPTPSNGNTMVYAPNSPTTIVLKWYSGYNVAAANDVVYFDQTTNPTTKITEVPAARGQHWVSVNVNPNQTYYFKVVTGGSVTSTIWSFKTVSWQCMSPNYGQDPDPNIAAGWPSWDINHDCVVNDIDLWYFAKDWAVDRGGGTPGAYNLEFVDLYSYAIYWLECRGRTNNGCLGW